MLGLILVGAFTAVTCAPLDTNAMFCVDEKAGKYCVVLQANVSFCWDMPKGEDKGKAPVEPKKKTKLTL